MKRWVSCAAAMIALLASGAARADAAQDVRDLRAGQFPLRYEFLGWDGASAAHLRTLACSDGGTTSCRAAFVTQAADVPAQAKNVLEVVEVYCGKQGSCDALDSATVSTFIAADKAARAALPAMTQTAPEKDPLHVFGTVAGESTKLEVRARDVTQNPDDPHLQVELVVRGKGGASETLGVVDSRVFRLESSKIRDAFVSSDQKAAAIVVEAHVGVMCWTFDVLSTIGSNLPRRKASLANTIGFAAWKKGDMTEALAGFTDATKQDATFGLGWYNRAAVESRNGDVAGAKTSFEAAVALDGSFAKRACKDADFAKLRAAQPGMFSCGR